MEKFIIKIVIELIIILVTRNISYTYICGGIAGILTVYSSITVDEFYKRLEKVSDK